jgi:hypothetical protein
MMHLGGALHRHKATRLRALIIVQLIYAGESLCCNMKNFYLSLELLAVNT